MIKAEHLSMVYGNDKKAVEDLSFEIARGEIVGFVGPNGAGKTTVIKMLTGILKPAGGRAMICGHDIVKEAIFAKRQIAYVADDPDFLLQLTGEEYIHFIADLYAVSSEERKTRLQTLAERFKMTDALGTAMKQYSHGMRQKIMVIAALTHEPPVWILDEPMTGLDPAAAYELKKMMREHADKQNSVLFSTHVLEVAEKLCDRIIIIDKGKSIYQGTVEELRNQFPDRDLETIFIEMTK